MATFNSIAKAEIIKQGIPSNVANDEAVAIDIAEKQEVHRLSFFGKTYNKAARFLELAERAYYSLNTGDNTPTNKITNIARMAGTNWVYNFLSDQRPTSNKNSVRKDNVASSRVSSWQQKDNIARSIYNACTALYEIARYSNVTIGIFGEVTGSQVVFENVVPLELGDTVEVAGVEYTVANVVNDATYDLGGTPDAGDQLCVFSHDFNQYKFPAVSTFKVPSSEGWEAPTQW